MKLSGISVSRIKEAESHDTKALQNCVNFLLDRYANLNGSLDLPIKPSVLAKLQNAIIIYTRGSKGWVASLMPMGSGFVININKYLPKSIKNFATCHEIAHTFFFDTSYEPPRRPSNTLPDHLEECLCFWAAREILVPSSLLKKELERCRHNQISAEGTHIVSETNLSRLANIFGVPPEIISSRLHTEKKSE